MAGIIKRISPELDWRLKDYQKNVCPNLHYTEASKQFAQESFTTHDSVGEALKKISKHKL